MLWWIWAVAALVFLIGEILTPGGIFIIFFAVGAAIVGVLELVGIHMALWVQLLVFSVTSIVFLLVFRKPILRYIEKKNPDHEVDSPVGDEITPESAIPVNSNGMVEYRGTQWKAVNVGEVEIAAGDVCRIVGIEGLRLDVEKK